MTEVTVSTSEDVRACIRELFIAARAADEFEFASTLLRVRGMRAAGWDPLRETADLANQLVWLIEGALIDPLRMRLLLFLYCHLVEASDPYHILANLLRVTAGKRYSLFPFAAEPPDFPTPTMRVPGKIKRIATMAELGGRGTLSKIVSAERVNESETDSIRI